MEVNMILHRICWFYKNLGDYLCSPVKIQAGNGFQKLYPVDIDGDGNDELVRINYWLHDQNSAKVDITTYDKNMTARNASFLLEGTFAERQQAKVLSPDYSLPEISMEMGRWNWLPFRVTNFRRGKPGHGQEPLCLIWN